MRWDLRSISMMGINRYGISELLHLTKKRCGKYILIELIIDDSDDSDNGYDNDNDDDILYDNDHNFFVV